MDPKDVAAISAKYSQLLQDYNICKEELEKFQQNNNQLVAEKDELVHKIEELNAQKEEVFHYSSLYIIDGEDQERRTCKGCCSTT